MEIKSSNGNTEKAPSPTFFTFNEDASYKFELYKADSLFIIYNGYQLFTAVACLALSPTFFMLLL